LLTRRRVDVPARDGQLERQEVTMGRNSSLLLGTIRKMIAGLQQHFAGQTLVVAGQTVAVTDVIAKLELYGPKLMSMTAAYQAYLAESRALAQFASGELDPLLVDLHDFVVARFGRAGAPLTDFGMTPRRPRKRTAQQNLATTQKAAATRVARKTLGPRQKKAIRGAAAPAAKKPADK
jgi:hypothetical protein